MARRHYSLFSNSGGRNGTDKNNDALSDSRKPNLNSRFRGPRLGVHLWELHLLRRQVPAPAARSASRLARTPANTLSAPTRRPRPRKIQ